jgi:hypothetical protein
MSKPVTVLALASYSSIGISLRTITFNSNTSFLFSLNIHVQETNGICLTFWPPAPALWLIYSGPSFCWSAPLIASSSSLENWH